MNALGVKSRSYRRFLVIVALLLAVPTTVPAHTTNLRQQAGKYNVDLCIPTEGIDAGELVEMFVRITARLSEQGLAEGPGVLCSHAISRITMPAMPGMPAIVPKMRSLGFPGSYGFATTFPHGGTYQVCLTIQPAEDTKPFDVAYTLEIRDETTPNGGMAAPGPYVLELTTLPARPMAHQPVKLTLVVRSQETRQPVRDFETVHEKKMHLIVVRRDLGAFFHEHPVLQVGGAFTHTFTFPSGGDWRLFAEVTPVGAGSQIVMAPIAVAGPQLPPVALQPMPQPAVAQDGMRLTMQPMPLPAHRTLSLTFTLQDATGHPITDLQPWLGTPAHLTLIEQDATAFVHSHPDERDPQNGRNGALTFLVRFPKPGIYKGWVQFQRRGSVHTLPFVIQTTDDVGPHRLIL